MTSQREFDISSAWLWIILATLVVCVGVCSGCAGPDRWTAGVSRWEEDGEFARYGTENDGLGFTVGVSGPLGAGGPLERGLVSPQEPREPYDWDSIERRVLALESGSGGLWGRLDGLEAERRAAWDAWWAENAPSDTLLSWNVGGKEVSLVDIVIALAALGSVGWGAKKVHGRVRKGREED